MTTALPDNLEYGAVNKINRKPCPYCSGETTPKELIITDNMRILIDAEACLVLLNKQWGNMVIKGIQINFCPMCGRRLETLVKTECLKCGGTGIICRGGFSGCDNDPKQCNKDENCGEYESIKCPTCNGTGMIDKEEVWEKE